MKNLFIVLSLVALVALTFVGNVQGASTGTVTATVTAQNISVSVTDGSIAYGTLASNTSKDTTSSGLNDTQTATNNGNVAEDFTIKGQNSANWTLSGTAGVDTYVHQFCVSSCTTPPTNYTALTTSNQSLGAGNVAANGTQTFDLRLTTPTSSSVTTQQSVDVTITATAH